MRVTRKSMSPGDIFVVERQKVKGVPEPLGPYTMVVLDKNCEIDFWTGTIYGVGHSYPNLKFEVIS